MVIGWLRKALVRGGLLLGNLDDLPMAKRHESERRVRARWSIMVNILSRGLAFLAVLVSARIALPDLGPERFGIWMTISSLLLMVTFLDFGVGNGLVAPVAKALAEDRHEEARTIASRGMVLASLIGLGMGTIVILVFSFVPLNFLFPNVAPVVLEEARSGLLVFGGLIGLTPTLGGFGRILAGMQRAYVSHIANAAGSVVTMVLLLLLGGRNISISGYILMTFGLVQTAALVTGWMLWHQGWLSLRSVRGTSWPQYRTMLATGGLFLLVQLTMVVAVGLDQTLISTMSGPAAVAGYAVAQRLFMLVSQPLYILNAPLWPAYADALHRGDHDDVRRTLRRSMRGTLGISIVGGLLLLAVGPYAWAAVTGKVVAYSGALMVGFAFWSVVESVSNAWGMYLNAAHLLREQAITMTVVAITTILAKIVALHAGSVAAVPIVGAVVYTGFQLIFYAGVFRRQVRQPLSA